ncbi:MAG: GtrA family protein [Oscillospiraceae bacterium]|nr:GtrA family protein [Oscillospiraceae bacterium]
MINKLNTLIIKHREPITYLFVGGMTTLVSTISLLIAYQVFISFSEGFLGASTTPAAIVSWLCAVTFAFFANKIVVFRNKSSEKSEWIKQATKFYCARLLTLAFDIAFLRITVDVFGFNLLLMKIILQIFVLIGNYLISKFFVFRKQN